MAQITLSDYVGFIFGEIVRARALADAESKRIALLYKDDEILKSFSVPRFKIPEMDITIPVLLSGAKYKTTLVFNVEQGKFYEYIKTKLDNARQAILIARSNITKDFTKTDVGILSPPYVPTQLDTQVYYASAAKRTAAAKKAAATAKTAVAKRRASAVATATGSIETVITEFYELLRNNPDPSAPDNIVSVKWGQLFNMMISANGLMADYTRLYPTGQLFTQSSQEVLAYVKANTVVSKTEIENILINPETQTVKDGSTDASVFTLKARIVEDGVFVKELKDENGNVTERIVEFD
jgi:hypothetical protein